MVKIGMTENVSDMIRTAQRDMSGTERIPTGVHLLSVNTTSATYLNESDAQHFHHIVAKFLVLSRRSIPDIQTAVAFLTTRVKKNDYKKLYHDINYLKGTPEMSLKLCAYCTDETS